jgi:hypothetical protein
VDSRIQNPGGKAGRQLTRLGVNVEARIHELHAEGMSLRAIGAELGLPTHIVRYRIRIAQKGAA